MSWAERYKKAVVALGCSPAECLALAVLVAGALAVVALLWYGSGRSAPPPLPAFTPDVADRENAAGELVVHVAGEVSAPGLYRLAPGSRVADALAAAGGPLPGAALDAVNLARPVADGEQLLVPGADNGEIGAGHPAAGVAAAGAWRSDGLLDVNRATAADFEQLPGIGPVLAQRLVEHREANGQFRSIGDLRSVPGIGGKKFEAIVDLITL